MTRIVCGALVALLILSASSECLARARPPRAWSDAHYARFSDRQFRAYDPANQPIDFKNIDYQLLSAAIFYETNRVRLKHGKRTFLYSPALRVAAFGHAKDMAETDFHSHINPDDPKKRTVAQRLALVGLTRCAMSENVAYVPARQYVLVRKRPGHAEFKIDPSKPVPVHTYLTLARQLLEGWMFSPGHRKNILSNRTRYLGCAAHYCQKDVLTNTGQKLSLDYVKACQNFASRRGPNPK